MERLKLSLYLFFLCLLFALDGYAQIEIGIRQALMRARLNNPVLRTQMYDVKAAETDIVTARLRLNPEIQNMLLMIPSKEQRISPANGILSPLNTQPWLQLGSPFRIAPKRKYLYNVALFNLEYSKTTINEAERNLAYDVANQWISAWLARINLEIINKAITNIDTLVSINKLRLENQVITETDLLRTTILAEQYKLQKRIHQQQLKDELNKLRLVLGTSDSLDIDMEETFVPVIIDSSLDSLMVYALQNRSDARLARNAMSVASENWKLQSALRYPDPFVAGIFNPQNGIRYIGYYVNVQIPIFNRNQGEYKKSKILQQQTESNLFSVQLKIRTDVTIAYQQYVVQKENLDRYSTILSQSVRVLNTVRYSYIKGNTTIVDFLEAQRTWYDTQKLYYEALKNFRESYVEVLYSTGMINEIM